MATKSAGKPAPIHAPDKEDSSWLEGYQEKGNVTVGGWKWEDEVPKFFKVLSPVHEGTGKKGSERPKPWLCLVRDFGSGKHYQLILGKMILDAFQESYPGDKINGKCFAAIRHDVPGEQWKRYDVREIVDPEPATPDDE